MGEKREPGNRYRTHTKAGTAPAALQASSPLNTWSKSQRGFLRPPTLTASFLLYRREAFQSTNPILVKSPLHKNSSRVPMARNCWSSTYDLIYQVGESVVNHSRPANEVLSFRDVQIESKVVSCRGTNSLLLLSPQLLWYSHPFGA